MSTVDSAVILTRRPFQKSLARFGAMIALAAIATFTAAHPALSATTTTYGGDAYGAYLDVPPAIAGETLVDTGQLPSTGGMLTANGTSVSVPGVLTADVIQCETQGSDRHAMSVAKVTNLGVLPGSVALTASAVTATSNAVPSGAYGNTSIEGLKIAGQPVQVTGEPNQVVNIPGVGKLVINQHIITHDGTTQRAIINALHLTLDDGTNIIVAHAASSINSVTPGNTLYSGRAFGIFTKVIPVETDHFADTGDLPGAGGALHASIESVDVPGVVQTGTITSETQGENDVASSFSKVDGANLLPGSTSLITADVVQANSKANSSEVTGYSTITNLMVAGATVTVTGAPNQTITIAGVGTLVINEQTTVHQGSYRQIIVNALHLTLTGGEQVVVAHAESDFEAE